MEHRATVSDPVDPTDGIVNTQLPGDLPGSQTTDNPVGLDHGDGPAVSPKVQHDKDSRWMRAEKRLRRSLDYLQDSWFLEVSACVLAVSLFGAEVGILTAYNRRETDSWPWAWSLNSAVALFTTVLESLLLFATASCLGQMKWLWFGSDEVKKKRLIWIDFLARSNTPVGALSLLFLHATTWR